MPQAVESDKSSLWCYICDGKGYVVRNCKKFQEDKRIFSMGAEVEKLD